MEEGGLRGGKKNYLNFFEQHRSSGVLFVLGGRGFGVGWLIDKIKETPTTRIPPFNSFEEFNTMVSSFVLQEKVYFLAKEKNIFQYPLVSLDFKKHKKNIMYNAYVDYLTSSLEPVDSLLVENKYKQGLLDSLYFSPKQAVLYNLNFSSLEKAEEVFKALSSGVSFDSFLEKHSKGSHKKIVAEGTKGFVGETAFLLNINESSEIINNVDKTFSIIKVLDFIPKKEMGLDVVYSQIEKNILKQQKKDLKVGLLENLKKQFNYSFNIEELF